MNGLLKARLGAGKVRAIILDGTENFRIKFKDEKLFNTALTHTSYANEHKGESYERLEYLGDAVLELLTSEYLYLNTNLKEGEMSKKRSSFVCENALALYARSIGLDKKILLKDDVAVLLHTLDTLFVNALFFLLFLLPYIVFKQSQ